MRFDPMFYPYPSRRMVSVANRGMVATSQSLAAQAGLDMLKLGGNAVDAAVATAAALTVVEPTSNGLGGDAFAIVAIEGKLYGLNSSGPAPRSLAAHDVLAKGHAEMPKYGWFPVTVPGAVAGWIALWRRFGTLPLKELLRPAISYAAEGYPVTPVLAEGWKAAYRVYSAQGSEAAEWFRVFAPQGRPPACGEIWRSPDHARTLQLIADTEGEAFYRGELAEAIHRHAQETGGFLQYEDLAAFQPEWVEPLSVRYHGYDVWELPPNGQGLVALIALGILDAWEFHSKDAVETYHRQIEALKLAMTVGKRVITERGEMPVEPEMLLEPEYLARLRSRIGHVAQEPEAVIPEDHGTVYLAAAMETQHSLIQSNYMGLDLHCGTWHRHCLQNCGVGFSLRGDANHPARRKLSYDYHLTKDGRPIGPSDKVYAASDICR